jgi:hypothetical protein
MLKKDFRQKNIFWKIKIIMIMIIGFIGFKKQGINKIYAFYFMILAHFKRHKINKKRT